MSETDAEIQRHTVVDARTYGESRPRAGERAALGTVSLSVMAMPLRPGDPLNVRVPIEGKKSRRTIWMSRLTCAVAVNTWPERNRGVEMRAQRARFSAMLPLLVVLCVVFLLLLAWAPPVWRR